MRWSAIASLSNDVDKKELLATVEGMEWIRSEIIVSLSNDADKKELLVTIKDEASRAKIIASLGNDTDKKWSDLWYIYQPYGYNKTLAQMTDEERANRKKYESIDSMREFSKWYKEQKL